MSIQTCHRIASHRIAYDYDYDAYLKVALRCEADLIVDDHDNVLVQERVALLRVAHLATFVTAEGQGAKRRRAADTGVGRAPD
jgi:hypothetical protein